jgi:membrane-bound lytic murein transglycosylase D
MEDVDPQLRRLARIVNLLFFIPFLSFASPVHQDQATIESSVDAIITFADEEVKHRLQSLGNGLVEHRFDPAVRSIIHRYVERSRTSSAIILGRATVYFPIFEAHLREAGLPEALKYLPIVESALRPEAVSRVGAQGLWQFMPATARGIGLVVDEYVDERIDPNRATEAALEYLQEQYNRFGDWALALAAYNAGQGNVQRAMRRSRRNSFWTLRRYLPGETANYVPGFIAATYLAEFYAHHNIEPIQPKLDRQLTETIKMQKPCSFYRIAQVTGLPIEEIEALNPGYRKGYIPGYAQGHYLVLPRRVMTAWRDYLALFPYETEEPYFPYVNLFLPYQAPDNGLAAYMSRIYTAHEGEPLHQAAEALSCSVYQLAVWNNLSPTETLCEGQELRFYRPALYKHIELPAAPPAVDELSTRTPKAVTASSCMRETCLPVSPIAVAVAAPLRRERTTGLTIQFRSRAATQPVLAAGAGSSARTGISTATAAGNRKALQPE